MNQNKIKILFLGRSEFLYNTILKVADHYEICGIITSKPSAEYTVNDSDYEKLAKKLNIPYFYKKILDAEIFDFCKKYNPTLVLSVNWVSIIDESFIDLFPLGVFNAHCGRLPDFKGNAIPNWCILREEKTMPINIHSMIGGLLDSGKIYKKAQIDLDNSITIQEINQKIAEIIPNLYRDLLSDIEQDRLSFISDCTDKKGFRCYPRLPYYSKINWHDSSKNIHNLIRASTYPYTAYCFYEFRGKLHKLYLLKSEIVSHSSTDIAIPGHVLYNDKKNGCSHIQTGQGIIALKSCAHDKPDNKFLPGMTWNSIRMTLSISAEDYIYEKLKAEVN